jgi:hypothetical protein
MTVTIGVTVTFVVQVLDGRPDGLAAQCDMLMDALIDLVGDGIDDPAVSADTSASEATVELLATASDYETAEEKAMASIRTAIHAVGGHTPGWGRFTKRQVASELVRL